MFHWSLNESLAGLNYGQGVVSVAGCTFGPGWTFMPDGLRPANLHVAPCVLTNPFSATDWTISGIAKFHQDGILCLFGGNGEDRIYLQAANGGILLGATYGAVGTTTVFQCGMTWPSEQAFVIRCRNGDIRLSMGDVLNAKLSDEFSWENKVFNAVHAFHDLENGGSSSDVRYRELSMRPYAVSDWEMTNLLNTMRSRV